MPQWAGSCWYFLRYIDPKNDRPSGRSRARKILDAGRPLRRRGRARGPPPDVCPVLAQGPLRPRATSAPPSRSRRLVNQGMILGETEYTGYPIKRLGRLGLVADPKGDFDRRSSSTRIRSSRRGTASSWPIGPEIRIDARAHKMSKARGNVINPDVVVEEYGADSLRLYEMFMGPLEAVKPWSMKGVEGVYRFLGRAWRMVVDAEADDDRRSTRGSGRRALTTDTGQARRPDGRRGDRRLRGDAVQHGDQQADGVRQRLHLGRRSGLGRRWRRSRSCSRRWRRTWPRNSGRSSATTAPSPMSPGRAFDPALLKDDEIEIPVQVNGKLKAKVLVSADCRAR